MTLTFVRCRPILRVVWSDNHCYHVHHDTLRCILILHK